MTVEYIHAWYSDIQQRMYNNNYHTNSNLQYINDYGDIVTVTYVIKSKSKDIPRTNCNLPDLEYRGIVKSIYRSLS